MVDETYSFGAWLKQRRRALDLTQAELARRLGCATVTLQKIELDERRPSKDIAARLAQVLDIAPEQRAAFIKSARGELAVDRLAVPMPTNAAAASSRSRLLHNLPTPSTPLIGREREVAAITMLLRDPAVRLVTLTGPGGTGKTRLTLQVASALLDDVPQKLSDGVWLVELAQIGNPALVPSAIAQVLGIKENGGGSLVASLKSSLRPKRLLLVLDNFEHLIDAAPFVSELLAATTYINVLVTSQSLLHLSGEHQFPVPPLDHPDLAHLPALNMLEQYPAVNLFMQRARAVKPDFALTDANAAPIAEICARLDGIPLALELAAARVRIFSPHALLARLDQRFTMLTGGARDRPARQQSLRSMIDWSYVLLDAAEQQVFARLAVFTGGCSLEAAEAVVGEAEDASDDVADRLVSLVDKSLLRQQEDADGEPRFTMLESIRAYGLERLEASGEVSTLRERHARYYMDWLETTSTFEHEHRSVAAHRNDAELGNLAAALQWIVHEGGLDLGVRWVRERIWFGPLGWMGELSEAWRRWHQEFLVRAEAMPTWERAHVLNNIGGLAMSDRAFPQAIELLEEALALRRRLDDPDEMIQVLSNLGDAYRDHGQYAQAMQMYEEALAIARAHGKQDNIGATYHVMGELALLQEDFGRALAWEQTSIPFYRAAGIHWGVGLAMLNASFAAIRQGDDAIALRYVHEAFAIARTHELPRLMLGCLVGFGALAAKHQLQHAALLLGAAEALGGSDVMWTVVQRQYVWAIATAQANLDPAVWNTVWAEGRAMTLEQTMAYMLEEMPEG